MTIIAANRKCMAADHRMSFGNGTPICHAVKIFREGDYIIGAAGSAQATTQWYEWMRRGQPPMENPSLPDEDSSEKEDGFIGLVLSEDGLFLYCAMCDPDKLMDEFYAIGTGASYAMEAMAQGKSPSAGVLLACKYDEGCGLYKAEPPTVLTVKPKTAKTKLKYQKPTPPETAPADKPTTEAADSGQVSGS